MVGGLHPFNLARRPQSHLITIPDGFPLLQCSLFQFRSQYNCSLNSTKFSPISTLCDLKSTKVHKKNCSPPQFCVVTKTKTKWWMVSPDSLPLSLGWRRVKNKYPKNCNCLSCIAHFETCWAWLWLAGFAWLTSTPPLPAVSSHHTAAHTPHWAQLCLPLELSYSWGQEGMGSGGRGAQCWFQQGPQERKGTKWHLFQGAFTCLSPWSHATRDEFSGIE